MADEEKNETTEETPEAEAPEAKETSAAQEAPSEEAPKESEASEGAPDGPAGEAEEPAADAEEVAGDSEADATSGGDEELEGLNWKDRQRLLRSRERGEQRPPGGSEERLKEAAEKRAAAIKARRSYRAKQRSKHEAGEGTSPVERESAGRKVRQGTVVSNKADKTITVRIDVARRHRTYEKIVRSSNTLHAHDEGNQANEGDLVRIVETRPISKTKNWRLAEIVQAAK